MKEGWENLYEVEKLFEEGRKRKTELDIKLLLGKKKKIALKDSSSIDTGPPPIKRIAIPSGTWKRSLNSHAIRSSMDLYSFVHPMSSLGWMPFLPLPASLVEVTPPRVGMLKWRVE